MDHITSSGDLELRVQGLDFYPTVATPLHTLKSVAKDYTSVLVAGVHRFERFKFKHNLYKMREERHMKPCTFGQMVSATLYEKR